MPVIKVHDKEFIPYLSAPEIEEQVKRIASEINRDYEGKKPLFIAILNGAFIFAADLFKFITIEAEISFIKLASYKGIKTSGKVITAIGLDADLHL
ncbi:MAG: phosphoribosyltransferase, partial [Ginsengibacter sp.]